MAVSGEVLDDLKVRLRRTRWPKAELGRLEPGCAAPMDQGGLPLLAPAHGEERRADLMTRCGLSSESARRALAGLAQLGLLR